MNVKMDAVLLLTTLVGLFRTGGSIVCFIGCNYRYGPNIDPIYKTNTSSGSTTNCLNTRSAICGPSVKTCYWEKYVYFNPHQYTEFNQVCGDGGTLGVTVKCTNYVDSVGKPDPRWNHISCWCNENECNTVNMNAPMPTTREMPRQTQQTESTDADGLYPDAATPQNNTGAYATGQWNWMLAQWSVHSINVGLWRSLF